MLWLIAGGIGGPVVIAARTRVVVELMAETADKHHYGANSSDRSQRMRRRVSSA